MLSCGLQKSRMRWKPDSLWLCIDSCDEIMGLTALCTTQLNPMQKKKKKTAL